MDKPLLTRSQVDGWKSRKTELLGTVAAAQIELADIERKLEAASIFMAVTDGDDSGGAGKTETDQTKESVSNAFERVLRGMPEGAFPAQLRDTLKATGYDMATLDANPNYLYTVLGRMIRRGRIEKRRNGKYRLTAVNGSSKEETGAVAAPARH